MDFDSATVKYKEIQQDAHLAELYSKLYTIPKTERVKVLMSWLVNAYSDLLIPVLSENETLSTFTVHIRLLDTFSNNSSYETVAQLASEFGDKFLVSQVATHLLENVEKTADITYYIQVICENLTCPSLIRKVMDVVTKNLTTIFIGRMSSENCLVVSSTLSLIKTLLEFYCEDFWYDLILQYLLPMKHLLKCQRQKLLPEIEFHESTHKLLELIPIHVLQNVDPTLLADHFSLYYQDEISRLKVIDTAIRTSLPSSKSDLQKVGLGLLDDTTRPTGKNQTYPMWIFRYDGTDFIHAYRKGFVYEEPEEFFEDDLFSVTNQLDQPPANNHTTIPSLTVVDVDEGNETDNDDTTATTEPDISSLSISNEANDQLNNNLTSEHLEDSLESLQHSDQFLQNAHGFYVKDKRKSIDSLDDGGAYFGPFLQSLFEIFRKWTALDPAVLFTATEIVSVLASSRIPLVNSIFLDMTLTLQPSYPSFLSLLHSVKNELDDGMKTYPDYIFRTVWKAAAKHCSLVEFYTLHGSTAGFNDEDESTFVGKLKRSISSNRSLRMAAEEVTKTIGWRGNSFRAFTDIFKNTQNSENISEFRLLNRSSTFESEEEEDAAKVMALRSILFTHWMLELGAIALQLSWGRRLLKGCGNKTMTIANHDAAKPTAHNTEDGDYQDSTNI